MMQGFPKMSPSTLNFPGKGAVMHIVPVKIIHGDGGERGIGPVIGICTDPVKAEALAKGKGWWGGNGDVRDGWAITDGAKYYLLARREPFMDGEDDLQIAKDRKKAAPAKLT